MKKCYLTGLISLLLCATLVLSGCSSKTDTTETETSATEESVEEESIGEENVEAGNVEAEDNAEPEESAETEEPFEDAELVTLADLGVDTSSKENNDAWKKAYLEVLEEQRKLLPTDEEDVGDENTPVNYMIYDIDKDGTPEMLVGYGTCAADNNGRLFTFDGEKAVEGEGFSTGHIAIYGIPDENGIIFHYGHMGFAFMEKVTLEDGVLVYEELMEETLDPETDDEYTWPAEVVPGAYYLSMCRIEKDIYVTQYEKIAEQLREEPEATKESDLTDCNIEEIVPDLFENNGEVFGVSSDGYGGDTGLVDMEYFLAHLEKWDDKPYQVEESFYLDVNADNVEECVLKLLKTGTDSPTVIWCVLSSQDGTTYAYVINYSYEYDLESNGTFVSEDEFYYPFRLIFDHDQCFQYNVRK